MKALSKPEFIESRCRQDELRYEFESISREICR